MREELKEALEEMEAWWDSESEGFQALVLSCLAALPGGDRAAELVQPALMGWKEAELLGRLLVAIQTADDVRHVVRVLINEEQEGQETQQ